LAKAFGGTRLFLEMFHPETKPLPSPSKRYAEHLSYERARQGVALRRGVTGRCAAGPGAPRGVAATCHTKPRSGFGFVWCSALVAGPVSPRFAAARWWLRGPLQIDRRSLCTAASVRHCAMRSSPATRVVCYNMQLVLEGEENGAKCDRLFSERTLRSIYSESEEDYVSKIQKLKLPALIPPQP